jgi:hypothetical protein
VNKLASKDIALVFERVGGLTGLVKWIKASNRNREKFYMKYGPEIAAVIASGSSDARVETDPQELTNTIERLLTDIRAARLRGDQPAATVTYIDDDGVSHATRSTDVTACVDDDGVSHVTIYVDLSAVEHRASNIDGRISDVTNADQHGKRDTAPDAIRDTSQAAAPDVKTTPAQVPQPIKRELTPMEARAIALGPPNPPVNNELNATQLFYESSERQRATWSAPRSWSGC